MKEYRPLADRVIIKCDPKDTQTASGIIITQSTARVELRTGTVVSVGPGKHCPANAEFIPTTLKPGDHVSFRHNQADVQTDPEDGQDYALTNEDCVVAIV